MARADRHLPRPAARPRVGATHTITGCRHAAVGAARRDGGDRRLGTVRFRLPAADHEHEHGFPVLLGSSHPADRLRVRRLLYGRVRPTTPSCAAPSPALYAARKQILRGRILSVPRQPRAGRAGPLCESFDFIIGARREHRQRLRRHAPHRLVHPPTARRLFALYLLFTILGIARY